MNRLWIALAAFALAACSSTGHHQPRTAKHRTSKRAPMVAMSDADVLGLMLQAEQNSTGKAQDVLHHARRMVLDGKTVIQGSCWDYLDNVYTQAGVSRVLRKTVYKGTQHGPYANLNLVKPGDWLYYINYSYHNVEHSGIFVGWADRSKNQALMLSYAGSGRSSWITQAWRATSAVRATADC